MKPGQVRIDPDHPRRAIREIRGGRPVKITAGMSGLTRKVVYSWENGTSGTNLRCLLAYAGACGYDLVFVRREDQS